MADMVKAMNRMPWVHWTVTSAGTEERLREYWFCPEAGTLAAKLRGGTFLYYNEREGTEYRYDPNEHVVYLANRLRPEGLFDPDALPGTDG